MREFSVSVRAIVEHCLREGDLNSGSSGSIHPLDGIRAHQRIQRSRPSEYEREVQISRAVEILGCSLKIQGRIDGIFWNSDGAVLEEIKTTQRELSEVEHEQSGLHWGQLQVYAALFALNNGLEEVSTQLTYYHLRSRKTLEVTRSFQLSELTSFLGELAESYVAWTRAVREWQLQRDTSLEALDFPFPAYRTGQRQMAVEVFRAIKNGHQLMVQAPTGIGKTLAALFPACKAMGSGIISRICYVTARTTGQQAAQEALRALREKGLRLKSVVLTAKEKTCFNPGSACNGEECEFARGYFDRISGARNEVFSSDVFDRGTIEEVARRYTVCPFELSLELAQWADCLICDYNYVFDPRVSLREFWAEDSLTETLIVDEAHNLEDRARQMFSPELCQSSFRDLRRQVRRDSPGLYRLLGSMARQLQKTAEEAGLEDVPVSDEEPPGGLLRPLSNFSNRVREWLAEYGNESVPYRLELLRLGLDVGAFLATLEQYDSVYATCYIREVRDVRVKLFCRDPSTLLSQVMQKFGSTVLFSGTLTPIEHFRASLGCEGDARTLTLPSPFPPENLCVLLADQFSTAYRHRQLTRDKVAELLGRFVLQHRGNYLLFFPSYAYLRMILESFVVRFPEVPVDVQESEMRLEDRDEFLQRFSAESGNMRVGFAVLGGIFGEGIDLVGERLSGAAIVGVGLPAICLERELIRSHASALGDPGFNKAYRYPGMNRVLQAVGRVIRSGDDRGAVLLVGSRFSHPGYRGLLPPEWKLCRIRSKGHLSSTLEEFWRGPGIEGSS